MLEPLDVIEIKIGDNVNAEVPRHFLYTNCKGDFSLCRGKITISKELDYLTGRFVVVHVALDGGGGDYPNGRHVFCEKLDDPKIELDFYETGFFSAMIVDRAPIGKAKVSYSME